MVEINYPGSNRNPPPRRPEPEVEEKVIRPVVTGRVTRRKVPLGRRMAQNIFRGDPRGFLVEVLATGVRETLWEAFTGSMARMVFPEEPQRHRSVGLSSSYNRPYHSMSSGLPPMRPDPRREMSHRGRAQHRFEEIVLETKPEADEILYQMRYLLHKYGVVSVADMYELLNISPDFPDRQWGWEGDALNEAFVSRVRGGGYLLELPKPEPIR